MGIGTVFNRCLHCGVEIPEGSGHRCINCQIAFSKLLKDINNVKPRNPVYIRAEGEEIKDFEPENG